MGDRSKRRYRRRIMGYLALALIVFFLFRAFGPALVTLRGTSLEPYLHAGDLVLARRGTATIDRGSAVLVHAPLRTGGLLQRLRDVGGIRTGGESHRPGPTGGPVPRIVLAVPGDTVRWDHRSVTVNDTDYDLVVLHHLLPSSVQTVHLQEDEYFVVAPQPGRPDSRIIGPVSTSEIRFHIQSVVLPPSRRGLVHDLAADFIRENRPGMNER